MKFSFMSFSCPEGNLNELINLALKYGYDGIEPRSMLGHKHGIELETPLEIRKEIRRIFQESGINCACIATSIRYCQLEPKAYKENIELTERFLELSADIGCRRLRVFGGTPPRKIEPDEAVKIVGSALSQLAERAQEYGVILCLETHDFFSRADMVAKAVRIANSEYIRANWDIMHPYTQKMTIKEAFDQLKDIIAHCHVHDGIYDDKRAVSLVLMGEGEIPYREAVQLLNSINYSGFLSGEYIQTQNPEEFLSHDIQVLKSYLP